MNLSHPSSNTLGHAISPFWSSDNSKRPEKHRMLRDRRPRASFSPVTSLHVNMAADTVAIGAVPVEEEEDEPRLLRPSKEFRAETTP
jgi:hypothetical protein